MDNIQFLKKEFFIYSNIKPSFFIYKDYRDDEFFILMKKVNKILSFVIINKFMTTKQLINLSFKFNYLVINVFETDLYRVEYVDYLIDLVDRLNEWSITEEMYEVCDNLQKLLFYSEKLT